MIGTKPHRAAWVSAVLRSSLHLPDEHGEFIGLDDNAAVLFRESFDKRLGRHTIRDIGDRLAGLRRRRMSSCDSLFLQYCPLGHGVIGNQCSIVIVLS